MEKMIKKALLDTSFILTCVRQKIDFFNELFMEGWSILIPNQVVDELKGLGIHDSDARLALILINKNKDRLKIIDIKNKNVDKGIISYSRANENIAVASLDRAIKKSLKNKKIIIRGKTQIRIE